jgi:heme/copper-type cytochrome/quinol oxidase subunit 3
VRRLLAWLTFGLGTLIAGYWTYVNGFQVITTLTFATRIDAPPELWALTGLYGLHVIAGSVVWFFSLRAMNAGRLGRGVALALASAVVSWPGLALLYAKLSGA